MEILTIEEAIAHAREIASEQKRRNGICVQNDSECDKFSVCLKCAEEHEQLAVLLEELKAYRTLDKTNFSDGYNRAIDDYKCLLVERLEAGRSIDEKFAYIDLCDIEEIAEQLKAGGENES